MMQGPFEAKKFVTEYLASDLPSRLVGFRNLWQLDDDRLPDPMSYLAYEPPAIDGTPMIITIAMNTREMERQDYGGVDMHYRVTYNMRTYVWVKDYRAEFTTEARDRLTAVVRTALLDHPAMITADDLFSNVHVNPRLDESTLREEYSDITYVKGEKCIAGSYLAYEFSLDEVISRSTRGDVDNFGLTVTNLDRLPTIVPVVE